MDQPEHNDLVLRLADPHRLHGLQRVCIARRLQVNDRRGAQARQQLAAADSCGVRAVTFWPLAWADRGEPGAGWRKPLPLACCAAHGVSLQTAAAGIIHRDCSL